jgi:hypothetical protein
MSLCKGISWEYVTCFMETAVEHITVPVDNRRNVHGNYAVGALIFSNCVLCDNFVVLVFMSIFVTRVRNTSFETMRLGVIVVPALPANVKLSSNWYTDCVDVCFEEMRLYCVLRRRLRSLFLLSLTANKGAVKSLFGQVLSKTR